MKTEPNAARRIGLSGDAATLGYSAPLAERFTRDYARCEFPIDALRHEINQSLAGNRRSVRLSSCRLRAAPRANEEKQERSAVRCRHETRDKNDTTPRISPLLPAVPNENEPTTSEAEEISSPVTIRSSSRIDYRSSLRALRSQPPAFTIYCLLLFRPGRWKNSRRVFDER